MISKRLVDSFKEFVVEYVKGCRDDIEWVDKSKKGSYIKYFGSLLVEVNEDGYLSISFWKEVSGEEKEELWRLFGLSDLEVLRCGMVSEWEMIGFSCCCCCMYYEDGKEKWSLDDFVFMSRNVNDDVWRERKVRR